MIDVANKRVTVMGLGIAGGGVGVAKWLLKHGAIVTITDLKKESDLTESIKEVRSLGKPVEFVLGKHRESDFTDTDLVIKNPGVPDSSPFLKAAQKAKVPVETDISIFVENFPGTIVGVTGTKGKTTTTTLLYQILKATGGNILLGGNLRKSPLDDLDGASKETLAVLELSSFQLEIFEQKKFSPHVAVWTNLYPDHMDRYKNMSGYKKAKSQIMLHQKEGDLFVTSADQDELVSLAKKAKGGVLLFSAQRELPEGLFVRGDEIIARHQDHEHPLATISKLKLRGAHNIANVLAAAGAALELGVPMELVAEVIENFTGVANRLEHVATINGVEYINDTASTIPASVEAALYAFKNPLILIAGGSEKNLPMEDLARSILKRAKKVVLLETPVGLKLADLMTKADSGKAKIVIDRPFATSMQDAVQQASKLAEKGDVVVLSPGAASFGMFRNEFDRGDQFVAAVKALEARG